ncbi:glycosyltransferase family 2 protein [Muriicola sp. Z0-33]|uniref:glycosyltransferase family 2 protein n=1 Tax=Muriicola sp. Z0-33 TaxID=2816957 RepID=UPI0022387E94|nr:glycosyltransferase family 2 protein [Muriicola sp. Z0-33]MCW5514641.1 glycosyltransferase family 2 protein [Muriicola sp. Z0-33]
MNKLVSIVTPVHNSEDFIAGCIGSVISQTYPHWEHILVDDCSTDKSAQIVRKYVEKDERIKLIVLEVNSGAGIARNKAIETAAGDYIAFLDSDDLWAPEKLHRQLHFMQDNNYYFSFTAYNTINENGDDISRVVKARERVTYKSALFKNPIGCLTVIYDLNFFGKQFMPAIRKRQDYALWLKLLKKTDAHGLNEILATYRLRSNSISSNKFGLLQYEWKIYREVEGLSFLKSLFYILSAVVLKMKSYF